jgi:hypothetical protein
MRLPRISVFIALVLAVTTCLCVTPREAGAQGLEAGVWTTYQVNGNLLIGSQWGQQYDPVTHAPTYYDHNLTCIVIPSVSAFQYKPVSGAPISDLPGLKQSIADAYSTGWAPTGSTAGLFAAQGQSDINYALGYMTQAEWAADTINHTGLFGGQTVPVGGAIVRQTLRSDSDLSGTVDLVDYNTWAAGYALYSLGGADWSQGDTDYNGTVDLVDYNNWAAGYAASVSNSFPAPQGAPMGLLTTPEPGSLILLGAGAVAVAAFVARRRRVR